MPVNPLIAQWNQDPEFSELPYDQKKGVLDNYFNGAMADDEFFSQERTEQDRIKGAFFRDHLGEAPETVVPPTEEPTQQGITFGQDLKEAATIAPRAFTHGSLGLAESAGTGIQYAGERLKGEDRTEDVLNDPHQAFKTFTPGQRQDVADRITKYQETAPDLSRDEAFKVAVRDVYQGDLAKREQVGQTVSDFGRGISESQGELAKQYEGPERIQGNVWDSPGLLKSPTWWVYNSVDMVPSFVAAMAPAAGTYKAVQVGGTAMKLTPEVIQSLARLGGAITGGAAGGGLEAAGTYKSVLEGGGSEEEAARAAEMMGMFSAGLNALSAGQLLKSLTGTFWKKVGAAGVAGVVEGLTEGAEEPAEVVAKIAARVMTGQELPDDISGMFQESLKEALTVAPIAAIPGFGGGAVSAMSRSQGEVDLLNPEVDNLVNEINELVEPGGETAQPAAPESNQQMGIDLFAPHTETEARDMEASIELQQSPEYQARQKNQFDIDESGRQEIATEEAVIQSNMERNQAMATGNVPGAEVDPMRQMAEQVGLEQRQGLNLDQAGMGTDQFGPDQVAQWNKTMTALKERGVDLGAHEAATSPENDLPEPTKAQKEAGVYKKGHINVQGLDISVENPKGSTRSGTDAQGNEWSTEMQDHYGYFKRSEGKDGDQVDVFIGPMPEVGGAFIVDQVDPETGNFDEHKTMLGYPDERSAMQAYHRNYDDGWQGMGAITEISIDDLKKWVRSGKQKTSYAKLEQRPAVDLEKAGKPEAPQKSPEIEQVEADNNVKFEGEQEPLKPGDKSTLLFSDMSGTKQTFTVDTLDEVPAAVAAVREERKEITPPDVSTQGAGEIKLTKDIIKQAKDDFKDAHDHAITAIRESAMGVVVGDQTRVDYAFDKKMQGEGLLWPKPENIYNSFNRTRELIRKKYGSTVRLYRAQGKREMIPNKHTLNWATKDGMAVWDKFYSGKREIISKDIPVDDIIAVYVAKSGKYDEFIVLNRESKGFIDPTQAPTPKEQPPVNPPETQGAKQPWENSELATAPNISVSRTKSEKIGPDKYRLVYLGTRNEVFPGEIFKTPAEARGFFKAQKLKAQEAYGKTSDSAPKEQAKPQTKKEKAQAEYRQYVDSLTEEQSQTHDALIEAYPKSPSMALRKLKKAVAAASDIVGKAEQGPQFLGENINGEKVYLGVDGNRHHIEKAGNTEFIVRASRPVNEAPYSAEYLYGRHNFSDITSNEKTRFDKAKADRENRRGLVKDNSEEGWYIDAYDHPIWTARKNAVDAGWRGPWTRDEVAGLTGIHPDDLKKDGKPNIPYEEPAADISVDDFAAMVDDVMEEEGLAPKPSLKKAGAHAAKGTKKGLEAVADIIKGLNQSGAVGNVPPLISPEAYETAKVHFAESYKEFIDAGNEVKEWIRHSLKQLIDLGATPEIAKNWLINFYANDRPVLTPDETSIKIDQGEKQITKEAANEPVSGKSKISAKKPADGNREKVSEKPRRTEEGNRGSGEQGPSAPEEAGAGGEPGARSDSGDRGESGGSAGLPGGQTDERGTGTADKGVGSELASEDQNHVIAPDDVIAPPGVEGKIKANIQAIQLLKKLQSENRNPSPDEKKILAKYVGWGAFSQKVFNDDFTRYLKRDSNLDPKYYFQDGGKKYEKWKTKYGKKLHPALDGLMTQEEWDRAVISTINAHYTSREIISSMWDLAKRLGFKGGTIGEPAAGVGHFFGLMPKDIADNSALFGVELDTISGGILQKLYPQANIQISAFEKSRGILDNSLDLVITNVPFADIRISDKKHPDYNGWSLHNYFIARSLTATKPGGLVMAISSAFTLDSMKNGKVRDYLAGKADFIGAVRLPNTAFKANAGTEVVTDILVFRKKDDNQTSIAADFRTASYIEDNVYQKRLKALTKARESFAKMKEKAPEKDASAHRKRMHKEALAEKQRVVDAALDEIRTLHAVNEYFHNNPEMVLGKHSMKGTMYASETYTVEPTGELPDQLSKAINSFPKNIAGEGTDLSQLEKVQFAELGSKEGTLVYEDGKPMLVQNGRLVAPQYINSKGEMTKLSKKQVTRIKAYMEIREITTDLFDTMDSEDATDSQIKDLQEKLNKKYDAFVKKYGQFNAVGNSFIRKTDNDFAIVDALEISEDAGSEKVVYVKAPIFTKRTIFPFIEPETAENIEDAASLSLIYRGTLSPTYIMGLLGATDVKKIKADLVKEGLGFINPDTGNLDQRDIYLSGNVKKKLARAKSAAEDNKEFLPNVKALENVIPDDLDIEFISFRLGSTWIPADVVKAFMWDVIDVDATIRYRESEVSSGWDVDVTQGHMGVKNRKTFGNDNYTASELITMALNLRRAKVMVPNPYPSKGTHEDKDLSREANMKMSEISDEFVAWAKTSQEWGKKLAAAYNLEKNGTVLRKHSEPSIEYYPNAARTLPDGRPLKMRGPQKIAVSRGLQESVLLAYGVGTGKTFIAITTVMEMRRIGTARKPVIVAHNQTIDQYRNSFKLLYPGAKVLIPDYSQRSSKMRKKTLVSMATGDWDAIVLPQSFFDGIANDPDRETAFVDEQIEMLDEAIQDAVAEDGANSFTVKDLVKLKERKRQKLEALLDRRKDEALTFEQMGIDALIIDEVHAYKRSEFYTKLNQVKGIDNGASQRSTSLILKSEFVREKTGGKNVITMTGTPISNTLAELWTMLRYVRPDILEDYGVSLFDNFATSFGRIVEDTEETASGFKEVERFSQYMNGPELLTMFFSGADVRLTKDAGLDLPDVRGGKPKVIVNEKSPELKIVIQNIIRDWKAWENLTGREKRKQRHVPLQLYNKAKKAAVDLRLIDPAYYKDDPSSKISTAANNIYDVWKRTAEKRSTQIVFLDLIRDNAKNPTFDLHKDLKKKLVSLGIPEAEILLFSHAKNEKQQSRMKEQIRTGEARVIFGTTAKLGIGIDIANKLYAAHHVSVPDRPMDIEQRDGRIIRQGNENKEVEIYHYCTKDTLDSVMFGRLMRKQKGSDQVLTGDISGRDFDDPFSAEQATFGEFAAAASGKAGKLLFEKTDLKSKEHKYLVAEQAHFRKVGGARREINEIPDTIDRIEGNKAAAERIKAYIEKTFESGKLETITVDGEKLPRKDAYEKIIGKIDAKVDEWKDKFIGKPVGDFLKQVKVDSWGDPVVTHTIEISSGGIQAFLSFDLRTDYRRKDKPSKKLGFGVRFNFETGEDKESPTSDIRSRLIYDGVILKDDSNSRGNLPAGFTRMFNSTLESWRNKPALLSERIEKAKTDLAEFKKISTAVFKYKQDLKDARARIAEINKELVALAPEDQPGGGVETAAKETPDKPQYFTKLGDKFTAVDGKPVDEIDTGGLDYFAYEDEGGWHIVEASTGLEITRQWPDYGQAVEMAKDRIEVFEQENGEGSFLAHVEKARTEQGESPWSITKRTLGNEGGFIDFSVFMTSPAAENWTFEKLQDMGARESQTRPPHWLAKKYPQFNKMYRRQQERVKDRVRNLSAAVDANKDFFSLKSGKDFDQLNNVIWTMEGKQIIKTRKLKKNDDGQYRLNEQHYIDLRAKLDEIPWLSDNVKSIYVDIRKGLDKDFATVLNTMAEMPDIEDSMIAKYRQAIGNIHNYFPHMRYGKYYVQAMSEGEVIYREHFDAKTGYARKAERVIAKSKEFNAIKDAYPDVTFKAGKVEKLPEEVFAIPIPIEALEAVMDAAVDRMDDQEAKDAFKKMLPQAVADALKARGWGSHMIKRKNIPGHEIRDTKRVLFDYKSGLYGWLTKMQVARDFSKIMADTQSKKKPRLWAAMRKYSYDQLENADGVDRTVDTLRSIFFAKYLGLNVKTAALNTTQQIIAGWPRLGMEIGNSFGRTLSGASSDIVNFVTKGGAGLSTDEQRLLTELYEEGNTHAQFLSEVRGQIGDNVYSIANKAMFVLGYPMQVAEGFNRRSLAIATFRAATNGRVKRDSTLNQYGYEKGESWSYADAKELAETVVNDAHFVYGKTNRPGMFRGSSTAKVFSAGYTFRTFSHNLINLWQWMYNEGGPGKRAMLKSLGAMIAIGGLTSIPLYKTIMHIIRQLTGDDPEEAIVDMLPDDSNGLRDMLLYGLPAAAGVTLGGSIGMEVPVFDKIQLEKSITEQLMRNAGEIIGVPWAVVEDVESAARAFGAGHTARAFEYMAPTAFGNISKGIRMRSEGQRSITGKPINLPGKGGARKLTAMEAIGKIAGFQPVSNTKAYDIYKKIEDFRAYKTGVVSKLANRAMNAIVQKDGKAFEVVVRELGSWNKKQAKSGRPEYLITYEDINRALSNRSRVGQPPQYLLPKAIKLRKQYFN